MAIPRRRLFNKVANLQRQLERHYDQLVAICPPELHLRGELIAEEDDFAIEWQLATANLGRAVVAIVDLADQLAPEQPSDGVVESGLKPDGSGLTAPEITHSIT